MLRPLRPGPLAVIHMGTIAVAVLGFLVYGIWELRNFQHGSGLGAALGAAAGLVGTVVTALYLRSLVVQRSRG